MKITAIGGSGLIGKQLVARLQALGHEAVAAAPSLGVDTLTGKGLAQALEGAQTVVDVSNSPSFEGQAVMEFFTQSTRNLLAAEAAAGVKHHLVLSIIGIDRLPANSYFQAKLAQETLVRESGIPFTIVRAAQFFEFAAGIAYTAAEGDTVRLPSALVQPIASAEVADALAHLAVDAPAYGVLELAGPEALGLDEFVRGALAASRDPRPVITDETKGYFGAPLEKRSLISQSGGAILAATRLDDWLKQQSNS